MSLTKAFNRKIEWEGKGIEVVVVVGGMLLQFSIDQDMKSNGNSLKDGIGELVCGS